MCQVILLLPVFRLTFLMRLYTPQNKISVTTRKQQHFSRTEDTQRPTCHCDVFVPHVRSEQTLVHTHCTHYHHKWRDVASSPSRAQPTLHRTGQSGVSNCYRPLRHLRSAGTQFCDRRHNWAHVTRACCHSTCDPSVKFSTDLADLATYVTVITAYHREDNDLRDFKFSSQSVWKGLSSGLLRGVAW
jgi:hypothetical protein